jgi:spore coat polysaccharide biosynthesis protein SpsF
MRLIAIVQARMGSTRLPGKVLLDVAGQTMLARVVRRVQPARTLSGVVVATARGPAEEPIVRECAAQGVDVFRGDEGDVLDRFYQAARAHQAEAVVRITADCPLIDPGLIDLVVGAFLEARPDYASNVLQRTWPRGLDTEVVALPALERAWREAAQPYERSHVTPYLYQNPDLFRLLSVTHPRDYSGYRWTVDTAEDLAFVRAVYERLGVDGTFRWTDVIDLLAEEPELADLNSSVWQKALHLG